MKKMIMALAAAVMMSSAVLAQDNNPERRRGQRMDRTEMIKMRTDETVQRFGLNEEQATKLLELNTRYADKISFRGPRFGGRRGNGQRPDSMRQGRQRPPRQFPQEGQPQREQTEGAPQGGPGQPGMRGNFEEMQKNMEAYEAELQQIMTEEQFKAYKADWEKRMQEGPRGRRPQRSEN